MSLPNKQSYDNLGGELNDYSPVTDPTTDLSAESSNEMRSDLAAMTRTCDIAWFTFTTDGADIFIDNADYDAVYGNSNAYKPVGTYISAGIYTFALPASIVDARGNTQYLNLRCGSVSVDFSGFATALKILTANTIEVFLYDVQAPGASDPLNPGDKITVFLK